jgi:chromosome segregation ATPase
MTGPDRDDDLADRVLALEQQQRADRRALGSLDADVSDLQAQRRQDVRLLQSLRDAQIEHGERLERLGSRLGRLQSRLESLESSTSSGFAAVGARLDVIVELLGGGRPG